MTTFDAAEKNVCVVRRQQTSTALQALALLNEPADRRSRALLDRTHVERGGSTLDEQVAWAFRAATASRPAPKEHAVLKALFPEQRSLFAADQEAAAKLLTIGETVNDLTLPIADLAAGTVLAKAILNHDEAVMRR